MAEPRITLVGEIDMAQQADLRAELRHLILGTDAHVLIDCAQMTFIDSTGIAVLVEAHRLLEEQGRHMLIANVRPRPRRTFNLFGVDDLLTYDHVPPACQRKNGRPIRAPIF